MQIGEQVRVVESPDPSRITAGIEGTVTELQDRLSLVWVEFEGIVPEHVPAALREEHGDSWPFYEFELEAVEQEVAT